jgi:hypothetical protein
MSTDEDSDWAVFKTMRTMAKADKAERRAAFNPAKWSTDQPGWVKHHDTHWSVMLLGDKLDFWPGPSKWRWRGKTCTGDVFEFLQARIREKDSAKQAKQDKPIRPMPPLSGLSGTRAHQASHVIVGMDFVKPSKDEEDVPPF